MLKLTNLCLVAIRELRRQFRETFKNYKSQLEWVLTDEEFHNPLFYHTIEAI